MSADMIYAGLVKHFGKSLSARIYACALIQREKIVVKTGDASPIQDEEDKAVSMDDAVRYTIGMVKRMRRQSIESMKPTTWENAVERLEMEQVEGERYQYRSTAQNAVARIDKINKKINRAVLLSALIEQEAERIQDEQAAKATDASDAALWIEQYMASLSRARLSWLGKVLSRVRDGGELTLSERKNISNKYTPIGVKPNEFIELAARYA